MKRNHQNVACLVTILAVALLAFCFGKFYSEHSLPNLTFGDGNQSLKLYTNHQFHFSMDYPVAFSSIDEQANTTTFKAGSDEPWGFVVSVQKTEYATTQDWLNAQPKGGTAAPGYQPVLWVDAAPTGKLVVAQYIHVDSEGNRPIYGKNLGMVYVQNGSLYTLSYKNELRASDVPVLDFDTLSVINSFQAFIE